jgi:hypothetical protein
MNGTYIEIENTVASSGAKRLTSNVRMGSIGDLQILFCGSGDKRKVIIVKLSIFTTPAWPMNELGPSLWQTK